MTDPIAAATAKLAANQSITILGAGDSTLWGWNDANEYTLFGWLGRWAIALAQKYDANVKVYLLNYPYFTAYAGPTTAYTSTRGELGPTITVYDGGWPNGTLANYLANYNLGSASSQFPSVAVDFVFLQDGFNESSLPVFTSNYLTLIADIRSKYSNPPIIVTTANNTTVPNESGHALTFAQIFGAMITTFLPGETLPLSPALQASTAVSGVWVLDTQQAGLTAAELSPSDGIHPNAAGYALQASWMFTELAKGTAPASAVITTTLGTPGGIPTGSGGLTLPANWKAGGLFTAQDENNIAGTLNALVASMATLGYSFPTVPADWLTGSVWFAADENAVATTINSLNAAVTALRGPGGPPLADVPSAATEWTAEAENIIETAINALHAAVGVLSGGG